MFRRSLGEVLLGCTNGSREITTLSSQSIEDENRINTESRNSNRNSCSPSLSEAAAANPVSNDETVIMYSYGRVSVPFLLKIPGKNITLQQFKTFLPKTGHFRYFFKTASNSNASGDVLDVFEGVNEDNKILPLYKGAVICVIEALDDIGIEYLRLHKEMLRRDEIYGQILSGHTKQDVHEEIPKLPKNSNRNSCYPGLREAAAEIVSDADETVTFYSYGHDSVPILSIMPGKNVTLQQFKTLLPQKGNFRYLFKTASNASGDVFEEVNDDHKILPLYEGILFCVIEALDDTGIENLCLNKEMQREDEIIGQVLSGHPIPGAACEQAGCS